MRPKSSRSKLLLSALNRTIHCREISAHLPNRGSALSCRSIEHPRGTCTKLARTVLAPLRWLQDRGRAWPPAQADALPQISTRTLPNPSAARDNIALPITGKCPSPSAARANCLAFSYFSREARRRYKACRRRLRIHDIAASIHASNACGSANRSCPRVLSGLIGSSADRLRSRCLR